jgi:hypothetical protein
MTAPEPRAKNLADLYDLAPLDWTDVRRTLETNLTQEPGTGGPGHHTPSGSRQSTPMAGPT